MMTVAVGWIRKINSCEELIIASDSRLGGGLRWDQCPKILTMPRSDCAICFSGWTHYAYPMMMQIYFSAGENNLLLNRAQDISDFKAYVLKHLNQLQGAIYDAADPTDINENEFIFGGYSWIEKRFKLWRYYFKKSEKRFVQYSSSGTFKRVKFGDIVFIGDKKKELIRELNSVLSNKYGNNFENYKGQGYDMEPLEALISLLRKTNPQSTIGGPPQIVKIYQHMNCRAIGVYWPNKVDDLHKNRTLLGRKMFDFEYTDYSFLDPETLRTYQCKEKQKKVEVIGDRP